MFGYCYNYTQRLKFCAPGSHILQFFLALSLWQRLIGTSALSLSLSLSSLSLSRSLSLSVCLAALDWDERSLSLSGSAWLGQALSLSLSVWQRLIGTSALSLSLCLAALDWDELSLSIFNFNLSVLYWHDKSYIFVLPKQLQLGCSQIVHIWINRKKIIIKYKYIKKKKKSIKHVVQNKWLV